MPNYADLAERYWKTYLPSKYARLKDPKTFFRNLSMQVRDQIAAAMDSADPEAGLPENPTYLQIKAAYEGVRKAAEEAALKELVFLPPEPGTEHRRMEGLVLPGWEDEAAQPPARGAEGPPTSSR